MNHSNKSGSRTHTHKSSGPETVIDAITNRVTGVSAGHAPFSILQSHSQVQRWRSSSQSDCPSCSLTTEQKAHPWSPSVCAFSTDLGFCSGCGPPDCEWPLLVALVVTVSRESGVTAQQRPRLLAAVSGEVRPGWRAGWTLMILISYHPEGKTYQAAEARGLTVSG